MITKNSLLYLGYHYYRCTENVLYRLFRTIFPYANVGKYRVVRRRMGMLHDGMLAYDLCGITKDSIVLDLGACVGGFTIRAAERCKHVYAVEPLYPDILEKNLELNHITNVTIIPYAIDGNRHSGILEFGRKKTVEFVTFGDILFMVYPDVPDFLKCDIEGAEKYVDFSRVSDVEAELHDEQGNGIGMYHQRNGIEVS